MLLGNLQCNLMMSFIKKSAKSLVPYSNQVGFLPNKCQRARRPCANPRLCWSALQNVIGKGRYLVAKRGFDFGGGQGILLDWSLAVDTLLSFCQGGKKCDDGRHFDGLFGFGLWLFKNEGGGNTSGAFGPDARTHQQYFLNALAGIIGTNIDQLEHRVRVDSNAIGPNSSFFWHKF